MTVPCPTCGVCPSCGHLPTISSSLFSSEREYMNVTVPVPNISERSTIVKVSHNSSGCPTVTIKEETWKNQANSELVAILRKVIKSYPKGLGITQWGRIVTLIESLEE